MQKSNVFQIRGTTAADQQLSPSQLMAAEADRRLNETLEKFRWYNDGTEADILEMIDDWAAEREGMS